MGTGTGELTLASAMVQAEFTIDASTFGGALDIGTITASGAVVVSTGTAGDLSATQIHTTGLITYRCSSCNNSCYVRWCTQCLRSWLRLHSVQEVVISMLRDIISNKGSYLMERISGNSNINQMTASGATTISVGRW